VRATWRCGGHIRGPYKRGGTADAHIQGIQYTRSKKGPPVGGKQSHLQHNFKTQAMRRSSGEWGLWLRSLIPYISTRVVVVGGGGVQEGDGDLRLKEACSAQIVQQGEFSTPQGERAEHRAARPAVAVSCHEDDVVGVRR
jgi:hypothetical protein